MGGSEIKWVVFDLGGVLLTHDRRWAYQRLARYLNQDDQELSPWIPRDVSIYEAFGNKHATVEELHALIGERYGRSLTPEESLRVMNSELGEPIESTVRLLEELALNHPTACLSNTNSFHWQWLKTNCDFMRIFMVQLASQELNCSKPGREIYEKALKALEQYSGTRVAAESCLFF